MHAGGWQEAEQHAQVALPSKAVVCCVLCVLTLGASARYWRASSATEGSAHMVLRVRAAARRAAVRQATECVMTCSSAAPRAPCNLHCEHAAAGAERGGKHTSKQAACSERTCMPGLQGSRQQAARPHSHRLKLADRLGDGSILLLGGHRVLAPQVLVIGPAHPAAGVLLKLAWEQQHVVCACMRAMQCEKRKRAACQAAAPCACREQRWQEGTQHNTPSVLTRHGEAELLGREARVDLAAARGSGLSGGGGGAHGQQRHAAAHGRAHRASCSSKQAVGAMGQCCTGRQAHDVHLHARRAGRTLQRHRRCSPPAGRALPRLSAPVRAEAFAESAMASAGSSRWCEARLRSRARLLRCEADCRMDFRAVGAACCAPGRLCAG